MSTNGSKDPSGSNEKSSGRSSSGQRINVKATRIVREGPKLVGNQRINVKATRIVREGPKLVGNQHEELWYEAVQPVGQGSFGTVYSAHLCANQEQVAIKKVLQDRRFKNRELAIMRRMNHPSVVRLLYFFYTCSSRTPDSEVYLQLVMDFVPENVYKQIQYYSSQRQVMPYIFIKLYIYQLFRALNYIHKDKICHRDIKPQNLLCNPQTGVLKLCDFGSAKQLDPAESNVSYICSRYYRAPELILCAVRYTCAIDVWSCGCVLGELLLNQPLFPGETGVDQLVEIIKILGTPSTEQTDDMNPEANRNFHFPIVPSHPWNRVFRNRTPQSALDLASAILEFSPQKRIHSVVALSHPFFDELREPNQTLPSGAPLPIKELFHLTMDECYTLTSEAKMAWNGGSGQNHQNVFERDDIFRGEQQNGIETGQNIHHIPNDQLIRKYVTYLQGKHSLPSTSEYDSVNFCVLPSNQSSDNVIETTNLSNGNKTVESKSEVSQKLSEDSAMKIVTQNGNSQSNGKVL